MPQFIINYAAQDGARVATAFGKLQQLQDAQGNPRDATAAEVKAAIINWIQGAVRTTEMKTAHDAAIATVVDVPLN